MSQAEHRKKHSEIHSISEVFYFLRKSQILVDRFKPRNTIFNKFKYINMSFVECWNTWELSGEPVVRIPHLHYKGHGFDPWAGG